jgi:hypothetical protein
MSAAEAQAKLTAAQITLLRERAIEEGYRIARKMFAKRGGHSEIHLSEFELGAMLAIAFELGFIEGVPQPTICSACGALSYVPSVGR